ncbi:hypothetical protein B0A55_12927, partial [Friedmanniomyces simplex]
MDEPTRERIRYAQWESSQVVEGLYLRALRGYEEAWGPKQTSTLDTVNNLGNLYSNQGKMKEAEEMYLRALTGREEAWGPKHTSTLDTVYNLGLFYHQQGELAKARNMYTRAAEGSFLAQEQSEQHIAALTEELREQRQIAGLGTTVTGPASGFDAGSRLTNAFEFLEMLLLELPNETALIAHGVNRQFKSVIAKSRPLQRKVNEMRKINPAIARLVCRAGTPVEEFACVSEVLRVLGIKEVDIPWPLEVLDALPNGRMHHNFSQFGNSKGDVPHILDTGQHETLPLGIDLVWKLTEVLKSDEDVTGSFFRNDVCDEDSVDALSAKRFIMDVTAGSDY